MQTLALAVLAVGIYAAATYSRKQRFSKNGHELEAFISFVAAIACIIRAFV